MYDYRKLYAAYFATKQRNVHYYHELSAEQQESVQDLYKGNPVDYIYEVNFRGDVINRRKLNDNDKNGRE